MKKLLAILSIAAAVTVGNAQSTNSIGQAIQDLVTAVKDNTTNWYFEAHGLYAPKLQLKYGGGIGAFYPLSPYVLTGVRVDYIDGGFWMPSGNATLQVPLKLTSWLQVTPFGYAGVGVPVSGATFQGLTVPGKITDNNGQPTAILGYGLALDLYSYSGTNALPWYHPNKLDFVADKETWTGFPGNQYRIGLVFNKKF